MEPNKHDTDLTTLVVRASLFSVVGALIGGLIVPGIGHVIGGKVGAALGGTANGDTPQPFDGMSS